MVKISAVYLIGNPEIPIHYTSLSQVEQALLICRDPQTAIWGKIGGFKTSYMTLNILYYSSTVCQNHCQIHLIKSMGCIFDSI